MSSLGPWARKPSTTEPHPKPSSVGNSNTQFTLKNAIEENYLATYKNIQSMR
jgi:hypothetical protein